MFRTLTNTLSRGMILAASGWLLAACSSLDSAPTAPTAAAVQTADQAYAAKSPTKLTSAVDKLSGRTQVNLLAFNDEVNVHVSASRVIGPEGGILSLPQTGFTLVVPRGAVSAPTTFSVTPAGGHYVAYDFEPHGTTFAVPLTFLQDLSKTKHKPGSQLRGGYFADKSLIQDALGSASVSELFTMVLDALGYSSFSITHFSGYLVSMS
jgi:hypothetical protein